MMKHIFYNTVKVTLMIWLLSFTISACGQHSPQKIPVDTVQKKWNQTIAGNFSGQAGLMFDSIQIKLFFNRYPQLSDCVEPVNDFYRNRKFAYAWYESGKLIEQAGNLTNRLLNLENDGVNRPIAYTNLLDSLLRNPADQQPDLQLELMLTAQYFVFAKTVYDGLPVAASKASGWNVPRKRVAYTAYLDSLIEAPEQQPPLSEPVYRQYDLLKKGLKKYRSLDSLGDWTVITLGKKALKPGDISAVIAQVKRRLQQLEDFEGNASNYVYDNALIAGVQQFQRRHGLAPNGLLNKETMAELNVPVKRRIIQIMVNMERSRWLPVKLNSDYLAVNIPEFKLHVYHADSLLWSCNVVVGQTVHPTTVFYGEIKYVVFSPYWNVPESIVQKEVLPGIGKDADYITHHQMEITGKLNGLPVVRQKPGDLNALGLVKFLFPNSYNIYLHDTPSKSLFGESARAFSHGCIRVSEPARLARFLLKGMDWDTEKINSAMHQGTERYVTLAKTVPVFIAYFTAFTDRDGKLNFRKDLYRLDNRLAAMLIAGEAAN